MVFLGSSGRLRGWCWSYYGICVGLWVVRGALGLVLLWNLVMWRRFGKNDTSFGHCDLFGVVRFSLHFVVVHNAVLTLR